MKIELLKKAGPIVGLIISLSTTSFAGYKIFAAPLEERKSLVPSLPDPTPTSGSEQEEIVETIFIDEPVSASSTPAPKVTPTSITRASGTISLGTSGATGARGVVSNEDDDDHEEDREEDHTDFDDDSDDTLTIKQQEHEDEHDTPEPTQKPESH